MFLGRFSRLWWPTLQTRQAAHVVNTWHVVYPQMYPQICMYSPMFFHIRLDEDPWNGGLFGLNQCVKTIKNCSFNPLRQP